MKTSLACHNYCVSEHCIQIITLVTLCGTNLRYKLWRENNTCIFTYFFPSSLFMFFSPFRLNCFIFQALPDAGFVEFKSCPLI